MIAASCKVVIIFLSLRLAMMTLTMGRANFSSPKFLKMFSRSDAGQELIISAAVNFCCRGLNRISSGPSIWKLNPLALSSNKSLENPRSNKIPPISVKLFSWTIFFKLTKLSLTKINLFCQSELFLINRLIASMASGAVSMPNNLPCGRVRSKIPWACPPPPKVQSIKFWFGWGLKFANTSFKRTGICLVIINQN